MQPISISQSIFIPSPASGVGVSGASFYTGRTGLDLVGIHTLTTRSDTSDVSFRRRSTDNGRTWSPVEEVPTFESHPHGVLRRERSPGYVDPLTGRLLTIRTEGVLPGDDPLEGMQHWALYYSVSEDSGRTECLDEQAIQSDCEFDPELYIPAVFDPAIYDAEHPFPGVFRGMNSIMIGDMSCVPLTLPDGTILAPCQVTPLGPDGQYENPGGGYTYHEALVLRGRWCAGARIDWAASDPVAVDPALSTRGMIEPTLGLLDDGRVLMVLRGSNDVKPHLPGYRWHAISPDCGQTWSEPEPWCYDDGQRFFSPSSCSQLLGHSSGALLWLGNIAPQNPRGNGPRYPLVMGEVDRTSGCLVRDSVSVIEDRGAGDDEALTLSNFYAREDRETGDVILHMTRFFAREANDWTADALLYRITLAD